MNTSRTVVVAIVVGLAARARRVLPSPTATASALHTVQLRPGTEVVLVLRLTIAGQNGPDPQRESTPEGTDPPTFDPWATLS